MSGYGGDEERNASSIFRRRTSSSLLLRSIWLRSCLECAGFKAVIWLGGFGELEKDWAAAAPGIATVSGMHANTRNTEKYVRTSCVDLVLADLIAAKNIALTTHSPQGFRRGRLGSPGPDRPWRCYDSYDTRLTRSRLAWHRDCGCRWPRRPGYDRARARPRRAGGPGRASGWRPARDPGPQPPRSPGPELRCRPGPRRGPAPSQPLRDWQRPGSAHWQAASDRRMTVTV